MSSPGFTLSLDLQVGKYEIQQLLGKGATGTVYLAKDNFSGNLVALKTIEPEVFRDPEFGKVHRAQFLNQASLAGKFRHPHIVSILDAVVEKNSGYIAMELVSGGELTQFAAPDNVEGWKERKRRKGSERYPYGDYYHGPGEGKYGQRKTVRTEAEARKMLLNYFSPQKATIGAISEKDWFFEAEIKDRNNTPIDRVIIDKRTGRIRSIY